MVPDVFAHDSFLPRWRVSQPMRCLEITIVVQRIQHCVECPKLYVQRLNDLPSDMNMVQNVSNGYLPDCTVHFYPTRTKKIETDSTTRRHIFRSSLGTILLSLFRQVGDDTVVGSFNSFMNEFVFVLERVLN